MQHQPQRFLLCVVMIFCLLLSDGQNAIAFSGVDIVSSATATTTDPVTEGDFQYVIKDGAVHVVAYIGSGPDIVIPKTLGGKSVEYLDGLIDPYSTDESPIVMSIELPVYLKSIGELAFRGCYDLTTIHLPAWVKSLSPRAFDELEFLESITVDTKNSSFASIDGVLYTKDLSTLVRFPSGYLLNTIKFPAELTEIGEAAFWGNTQVQVLKIPGTVKKIGKLAFAHTYSLQTMGLPESLEAIDEEAFRSSGLTAIELPKQLNKIGKHAFANTKLASITIPASVQTLDGNIFGEHFYLKTIQVDAANPNYTSDAGVLFNKSKDTLLNFPVLHSAKEYSVPDSVKTISDGAFENSRLTRLFAGESLTQVNEDAFLGSMLVLSGYAGSFIETYAKSSKMTFVPINVVAKSTLVDIYIGQQKRRIEAFMVNHSNYMKLRDVAFLLKATTYKFNVTWDTSSKMVGLQPNTAYMAVGNELTIAAKRETWTLPMSPMQVLVSGKTNTLRAYKIQGANYVKLRDVCTLLGIPVTWDTVLKAIRIG